MIDDRRLLLAVTAAAIIGTLALLAYSASMGPLELGIGEIGMSHDGALVATSGTVTAARTFSDGGASLTISDLESSSSIGIYIPPGALPEPGGGNLVPGARIRVTGTVSTYREFPEISVSSPGGIIILSGPEATEYGLDTVMRSIHLFQGMEISTSGQIVDMKVISSAGNLTGTAFTLRHQADGQAYYLDCMFHGRDLTALYGDWDSVNVTGTVSYVQSSGRWRMSVEIISGA